jgi:phosphomannomutase/phosphoglucomutase
MMALLYAMDIKNPTVIGEVKCSFIMYDELEKRGAKAIMYKTGHSNLKVKMKETNADLACEVSGHIFFKHRYFGYDDAIYATFRMLELIRKGIDLDEELQKLPKTFSTDEIQIKTTEKEKFQIIEAIKELLKTQQSYMPLIKDIIYIDGVRINFQNGWGLVRASNTTPVLVTRFESSIEEELKAYQEGILKLIEEAKKTLS